MFFIFFCFFFIIIIIIIIIIVIVWWWWNVYDSLSKRQLEARKLTADALVQFDYFAVELQLVLECW